MISEKEILNFFQGWDLTEEQKIYLRFHSRRYQLLLKTVSEILETQIQSQHRKSLKILDIGPYFQTSLFRKVFKDIPINTLGFECPWNQPGENEQHFSFDLNDAQHPEKWPSVEEHDLVILAEVIEHLYTSPRLVLQCVSSFLKPRGFLVLQTPNALSLGKRLKMLVGRHPYMMIRESRIDPGHFREYTCTELVSLGQETGLTKISKIADSYLNYEVLYGFRGMLYRKLNRLLPSSFRDGLTLCFQKK